ncbi:hypothetical protein ADK67_44830 [Saccharothrix sp. NRRL B-16348]|uniref:DUF4349 domain-containing protein n=1 Tax=Saccharothrix sp. NRRL B-16348 TaxID=1415542 RepID=UPI0006C278D8|nr:DUF4349 domain-containing protein [Saccharothrix sp. NRRL B-16348]KOX13086.1 hypothetical protein ADK67_44830 [Saccharothrix sp. NRRL B-16348]
MGRRVGLVVAAFALAALAGCAAGSSGSAADHAAVAPAPAQDNAQPGGTPKQESAGTGEAKQAGTSAQQNRQLVRTATVELRASDTTAALSRVKDLVIAEGGYSAQEKSQPNRASVTVKVPGDRLDPVLESISGLEGVEVSRRELQTEDVTEQLVDVEVRLANQRASVERVRGLLDRATTTSEITDIEAELTKRQSELESLQRRHETLKSQVAMSTLTVVISAKSEPVVVVEDENDFLAAFAGGWGALVKAFGWLLVVLGGVLPFAVVLGLPAFGYLWWRRRRKVAPAVPAASSSTP